MYIGVENKFKYLRCKVSLQCEYAGGSLASEDGGNVFRRCYKDMAFPQCGSERVHAGELPTTHIHRITTCNTQRKQSTRILDVWGLTYFTAKRICKTVWQYLDKSGSTCVTAVRLLSRVDAGVSLQISRPVELRPTHITAVWFVYYREKEQKH